ncbi:MAG: cation-transporting P-type ATPase, partial [Candidatus Bathyarchaeia archaeon]
MTGSGKVVGKTEPCNVSQLWQRVIGAEEFLFLPIDELLLRLNASRYGLSSQEVEARLQIYGRNELAR